MLEDTLCEDVRLRGHEDELTLTRLNRTENVLDTGIWGGVKDAIGRIDLAVEGDGTLRVLRIHAIEVCEAVHKGRADKLPKLFLRLIRVAEVVERVLYRFHDARTGVHDRSIEVKKNGGIVLLHIISLSAF